MKQMQADVVVVGAGSAGTYLAWQLALQGFQVLVLEARPLEQLGQNIEIFHMDQRAFGEFGIPEPEPPERIHLETSSIMWSPDRKVRQVVEYPFFVMNLPAFFRRLHGYARQSGVEIIEQAHVDRLIFEDGRLAGVAGTIREAEFEARGRLVVDASGWKGAPRTLLPADYGIETQPIDPQSLYCCCLELRTNLGPNDLKGSNSFIFHKGFWNRSYGDDIIIGMSQPGGYEYTWQKHRAFREEYFGDPGQLVCRRQGLVPFRRGLLSCVADHFIVVGDAAFQNKPFSGEGITSGFGACKVAARAAGEALRRGDLSAAGLWAYNRDYFRDQRAKFAAAFAQLPAAVELSRQDVNYLYHHQVIFNPADFRELNETYETRMGPAKMLRTGAVLAWGVLTGRFSRSSLDQLLRVSGQSDRLKQHYQNYPDHPQGYPTWKETALRLWGENPVS